MADDLAKAMDTEREGEPDPVVGALEVLERAGNGRDFYFDAKKTRVLCFTTDERQQDAFMQMSWSLKGQTIRPTREYLYHGVFIGRCRPNPLGSRVPLRLDWTSTLDEMERRFRTRQSRLFRTTCNPACLTPETIRGIYMSLMGPLTDYACTVMDLSEAEVRRV